jgi:hypothetical protein
VKQVILTDEDYEWLGGQMLKVRRSMYANASQNSVEMNERIERVVAAFNGAEPYVESKEPATADAPKRSAKKARRKKAEPLALARDACRDHPKYTAARTPRSDCESCWNFYKALHPTAYPQAVLKYQREQRRKAKKA